MLLCLLGFLLQVIGVIVSFRTYTPEPSRFSLRRKLSWDLGSVVCFVLAMLVVSYGEDIGLS